MLIDNYEIKQGNCLDVLKEMPDNSVQCCVTSPPYYGLRDYGTGRWEGGDPDCPHYRKSKYSENDATGHKAMGEKGQAVGDAIYKSVCPLCGAVRVDEQIGIEETPEEYIDKLVKVFHEVKRVLKDDGTLWVNIGDTYNGSGGNHKEGGKNDTGFQGKYGVKCGGAGTHLTSLKNKDLIGIPWMLAFALRNDGWYLRQDIIWHKPNPMPESVTDRCTKSHEYIFLLTKSQKYYFDNTAIMEESVCNDGRLPGVTRNRLYGYDSKRNNHPEAYNPSSFKDLPRVYENKYGNNRDGKHADSDTAWNPTVVDGVVMKNKRDVWSVNVNSYKGAHFATYPEELVVPCVLSGSSEGDTVLDPFNGSGTTGVVALKNGRKYIGIELNPEYVSLTDSRMCEVFLGVKSVEDKTKSDEVLEKTDLLEV